MGEESSEPFKTHCGNTQAMATGSDCKAICELPKGWPRQSGTWVEQNQIKLTLPWHEDGDLNAWGFSSARAQNGIGVCEQGVGVGSNGTSIGVNAPEFEDSRWNWTWRGALWRCRVAH